MASLLDTHQNQLKKKVFICIIIKKKLLICRCFAQKSETVTEKAERQPFDPEKDLQVRKLDQRQTRSIISNSKLLNTRFSTGPSKFL